MKDSKESREHMVTLRLSDAEYERIVALGKHHGLDRSGILRMLVKHAFDKMATYEDSK